MSLWERTSTDVTMMGANNIVWQDKERIKKKSQLEWRVKM